MQPGISGWQLHSHGVNHQRFSEITEIEALLEIKDSKQWFDTYLNLTPICFVYPYGVRAHKNIVRKYYNYERPSNYNTISLWNGKNRKIPTIYSSRSFLKVSKKPFVYTNILFHSVVTNPQQFWNNSPKQFKEILNNIYKNKIEVITLSEAIKRSVKHTNTERAKHFLITKFWGMNEFARSIAPSGT